MANREDNLKPQSHELTVEEAKKGGLASVDARRRKKSMREIAQMIGSAKLTDEKAIKKICDLFGVDNEDVNHDFVVVAKQFAKAEKGDTQSAKFIADLKGEIKQNLEVTGADGKPLIPEDTRTQEEKEAEIARLLNKGE